MKARHIALCLTLSLLGAGLQAQDDLPQGWVCETWFYDGRGNTVQHVKSYPAGTAVKEQCGDDFAGNLTERVRAGTRDGNALATETLHYTYDRWGRALATTHKLDDSDNLTLVSNTYDAVGRLASTSRGGTSAQSAPAALFSSYAYNVRGWLTGIGGSLFSEMLAYETPRPGSLDGEWGGNISSATWKTAAAPSDSTWYDYGYDRLGRLVDADYGSSASSAGNHGQSYWYDLNGNMTGSQSPGRHTEFAAGDRMALLSWTFSEGNAPVRQLREYYKATTVWSQPHPWQSPRPVIVMEPETLGRVEEYFTYDAAGNRTATRNVQGDTLALMRYNLLNLPEEYVTAAGDTVRYVYSADGEKLFVEKSPLSGPATGTEYAANYRIKDGTLAMIHTDAGYYTPVTPPGGAGGPSYMHVWYLKDHLGNNRVLADGGGNALAVQDYAPYGDGISAVTTVSLSPFPSGASGSPYRYGGKEWSVPTSTYDFEARQFSPFFHRFTSMDPLAEKYYSISPYAYCADNPVNLVDPEGFSPIYGPNGQFLGTDDEGLQGYAIIMSSPDSFSQNMAHDDAVKYDVGLKGLSSLKSLFTFLHSYTGLSQRPDYDGFITIDEGIDWAKQHPNALDRSDPAEALYVDASQLDFGDLSVNEFLKSTQIINVFRKSMFSSYLFNPTQRHTAYALGQVEITLLDREKGTVRIVNGKGTVYDWDKNGKPLRQILIAIERLRAGLNDSHGFPVYYYGTGQLNR